MCAKNYENWLAINKVIAKINRLTFLPNPVYEMLVFKTFTDQQRGKDSHKTSTHIFLL